MKIRTLQDANKSLTAARIDLARCMWAQNLRDQHPTVYELHDRQDLLKFYVSQWPQFASDKDHRQKWSDQLDLTVESIEKYIQQVKEFVEKKLSKPKCCLPKKKQRELGLLPKL